MAERDARDTRAVIEDHLTRRLHGDLEGDLAANYAPGVVVVEPSGIFFGHAGVRRRQEVLDAGAPGARLGIVARVTVGEIAYVLWRAQGAGRRLENGVDTYVVNGGLIVAETSYYVITD